MLVLTSPAAPPRDRIARDNLSKGSELHTDFTLWCISRRRSWALLWPFAPCSGLSDLGQRRPTNGLLKCDGGPPAYLGEAPPGRTRRDCWLPHAPRGNLARRLVEVWAAVHGYTRARTVARWARKQGAQRGREFVQLAAPYRDSGAWNGIFWVRRAAQGHCVLMRAGPIAGDASTAWT